MKVANIWILTMLVMASTLLMLPGTVAHSKPNGRVGVPSTKKSKRKSTKKSKQADKIVFGLQPCCNVDDPREFNMCLDLKSLSGNYEPWMEAFAAAKDKWESIIVGDSLPLESSVGLEAGFEFTCTGYPSTIDDLYICGEENKIDGEGSILGYAGPRYVAQVGGDGESPPYYFPLTGIMVFDTADIKLLLNVGFFDEVVMHEMGHVLGIGAGWYLNGVSNDFAYSVSSHAQAEWNALGCTGRLPIEQVNFGEIPGHWDDKCLRNELMTGSLLQRPEYVLPDSLPISRVTISSLKDIGYEVDYSQADPFTMDDLGDCGSFCPEMYENRRLRPTNGGADSPKRRLSEDGHRAVMMFAAKELEKMRVNAPDDVAENVAYVGGDFLHVFFWEDGVVHSIDVTWDQVAHMKDE